MPWLDSPYEVVADLAPATWTFVVADRTHARSMCVAAASFVCSHPTLTKDVRAFRASAKLPRDLMALVWPAAGDRGVARLDARAAESLSVPKARAIRERIAPLVRSGGRVREIVMPHEALPAVLALRALPAACVLVLQAGALCLARVRGSMVEARYLSWDVPPAAPDGSPMLLERYQFAARLGPHVREILAGDSEIPLLVCGCLPSLRPSMVPLVEELDREIEVLDADLPGVDVSGVDADDISARQLAWALASRPGDGNGRGPDRVF